MMMSRLQKGLIFLTFLNLVILALAALYARDSHKLIWRITGAEARAYLLKAKYDQTVEYCQVLVKNLDEKGKKLNQCVEENNQLKDGLKCHQTGGSE